jgi:ATP-binding protein involved in chromosome partitioning
MQQQNDLVKEKEDIKKVMSKIKHTIMVMSNKGGVGKSTISVNIAQTLAAKGYKVGVLDIDIHGPSQGKLLGVETKKIKPTENNKMLPVQVSENIKLITIASLMDDQDTPLIWRGPLKIGILKQFIKDVEWGELDYLVIDAPPGTGDEPLTIAQLLPEMAGIIVVTTPQELALLDSKKAINFIKQLEIPILGLIENMSGFKCPHCAKNIDIFHAGGGKKAAEKMLVDVLGILPFEQALFHSAETGTFLNDENVKTTRIFKEIVKNIENKIKSSKLD